MSDFTTPQKTKQSRSLGNAPNKYQQVDGYTTPINPPNPRQSGAPNKYQRVVGFLTPNNPPKQRQQDAPKKPTKRSNNVRRKLLF